jgi:hypothetical protein
MRYLWIGAVVSIALFGAACSGPADKTTTRTTVHHRHHHKTTTTTTTTKGSSPPTTKLASTPKDRLACSSFAALGKDVGKSHRVIVRAFKKMFRRMKHSTNPELRKDAHQAAKALIQRNLKRYKHEFTGLYLLCYSIQVGTPSS